MTLLDITLPETNKQELTQVFNIQTSVLELIAQRAPLTENLDKLCLMAEQLVGDCLAAVMIYKEDKSSLSLISSPSYPEEARSDFDNIVPGIGYGSCALAVHSGDTAFIENVMEDASWSQVRDLASKYGIGACWSYPIHIHGEIIGSFSLTSFESRKPTHLHQYALRTASHLCSLALERTRADELLLHTRIAFENSSEGIVMADSLGRIIRCNSAFTILSGFEKDELINKDFFTLLIPDEMQRVTIKNHLKSRVSWRGDISFKNQDELTVNALVNISVVENENPPVKHFVIVISDISSIKKTHEELDHIAHHDTLTKLPNRLLFEKVFHERLEQGCTKENPLALMFIDLDNFKDVNDSHGHDTGDSLLKIVGKRIISCIRDSDVVARYGGDEFVVLLSCKQPSDANTFATRITEQLSRPFHINDMECICSASIGIAIAPQDGMNIAALVKSADIAMYKAKELGKNRFTFFTKNS